MVFKITVKTLDSQNYDFEVDENWTVQRFKEHIESTVNAPSNQQKLIFCGRVLENDKKLNDYGCNGMVLHLVRWPTPSLNESFSSPPNTHTESSGTLVDSIRIIGENSLGNPLDVNSQLNQVLRQVASSLVRAFGSDGLPTNAMGTSIGVTITPHFVPPLSPTIVRENTRSTSSSAPASNTHSRHPPAEPGHSSSYSSHSNLNRSQTSNNLDNIRKSHPDWIYIIEADIKVIEQQRRTNENQHFFSDAYLSSIPRKKRRLLIMRPEDKPILQASPLRAISNLLRRAITNSEVSIDGSLNHILEDISSDQELQGAYEEFLRSAVEGRLKNDTNYCPNKFKNSRRYFM